MNRDGFLGMAVKGSVLNGMTVLRLLAYMEQMSDGTGTEDDIDDLSLKGYVDKNGDAHLFLTWFSMNEDGHLVVENCVDLY